MAKKKIESQIALFDVPAIKQEYHETKSAKKKDEERAASIDVTSLGLNAIVEGKSKRFPSFETYIIHLKGNY